MEELNLRSPQSVEESTSIRLISDIDERLALSSISKFFVALMLIIVCLLCLCKLEIMMNVALMLCMKLKYILCGVVQDHLLHSGTSLGFSPIP